MTTAIDSILEQAGTALSEGNLPEAARLCNDILQRNENNPEALRLMGLIALQARHLPMAAEFFSRTLRQTPSDAHTHNLLGLSLMQLGRHAEAVNAFQAAIELAPDPAFYNNLGLSLKQQDRFDQAMAAYRKALALNPEHGGVHYNMGNIHRRQDELEAAAACFRKAAELSPDHNDALASLGEVLMALKRPAEALPVLESAVARLPKDAVLRCELGDALQATGQMAAATDAYQSAARIDSRQARAWYGLGCIATASDRFATAVAHFERALTCAPDWSQARHNLGQARFNLGEVDQAMALLREAEARDGAGVSLSAMAVIVPGDPGADHDTVRTIREEWARRTLPHPRPAESFAPLSRPENGPLRVGYISAFFQDRNWMKPVWGLINAHDRERLCLHLFSDGGLPDASHGYQADARDRLHDISDLDNEAAASLIEASGVQLLVDLNGYSATGRLPLIALRPAPVIIGWFNLFATTGIAAYDYLVGDESVVRRDETPHYSEKLHRVQGSYLTFAVRYPVPNVAPPPCIQNGFITFGCLASQYKLTDGVIQAWAEILNRTPESRLFLKNSVLEDPENRSHLMERFDARRISADRLVLEGGAEHYRFLESYGAIDIALDPFPYNGGTTTTEALWQGVPVVTFSGDRWASRTSASLLNAAGLHRFVAPDLPDHIDLAVELATAPDRERQLADLRRRMRKDLAASPVCDTTGFARQMEAFYRDAWNHRHRQDCS